MSLKLKETNISTALKNPSWWEANQHDRGVEPEFTE